jgi:ATP-binding cassette subfamily C protein
VKSNGQTDELRLIFESVRGYFGYAVLFSMAINLLYLASPLYMLQVYDRVVNSGSIVTLVMLTLALLFAFAVLASLDVVRARVLTRASIRLDRLMAARVMSAIIERATAQASKSQLLRDFDNFRQFATGSGIHALFDLPWAPLYIAVIFMLHPLLGGFALCSAAVLIGLAILNEGLVRPPLTASGEAATRHYGFTALPK